MTIASLIVDIHANTATLQRDVEKVHGQLDKVGSIAGTVGKALLGAFTATALVNGLRLLITSSVDYADTLVKLHDKTDLTYRDLQLLEDIANDAGVPLEKLTKGVQMLQQRLGDGSARKGVEDLGLSFNNILAMSPADQFATIGTAIANIESPTVRARIAAAVFGKTWQELLPALKANMADVAKGATIMSDRQIEALDRAGDRFDKFLNDQKRGWAGWVGGFLVAYDDMRAAWHRMEVDRGAAFDLPTLPKARPLAVGGGPSAPLDVAEQLDRWSAALDKKVEADKRATKAQADHEESVRKFLEMSKAAMGSEFAWQREIDLTKFKTDKLTVSETQLFDKVSTLTEFISRHKGEMFPELPQGSLDAWKLGQQTITDTRPPVDTLTDSLTNLARDFADLGDIAGGSLGKVARDIGTVVVAMQTAEDAGKLMKAGWAEGGAKGYAKLASGALAAAAAIDAATSSGNKTKDVLGGAAAGAQVGSNYSPVGTAIGAGVGALVGWAKGNAHEGKYVSPLRDEFFELEGGLDTLNPKMVAATGNLKLVQAVFDATNVKDYNAAIAAVNDTLAAYQVRIDAASSAHDALTERMNGLVSLSPELEAALQSAYDATKPEEYLAAASDINAILDEQADKQQFLEETMRKYGLSWKDLGEEARKAHVAQTAGDIEKEFRVLLGAGVDVNNIMRNMGDSVSDFVLEAVKSGTEVPESFRDVIQTAIDAGEMFSVTTEELERLKEEAEKLGTPFDDSKLKINDIKDAGIVFGTTMELATRGVQTAIERLASVIETVLGPAIQNIPDGSFTVKGKVQYPDLPDLPDFPEPREMAAGGTGRVTGPTLFIAGEAGPEDYAFSGANKRFGSGGNVVDMADIKKELAATRREAARDRRAMPRQIAVAISDALKLA